MPRPRSRSIPGLLLQLAALHVRRRPVGVAVACCAAAVVVALAAGGASSRNAAAHAGVQAAVLSDGFVLSHPGDGGHHFVELDRGGTRRHAFSAQRGDELRTVGTSIGTAIAWQDGRKLRLARAEDDRDMGTWGKSVRQLCDGVASNDLRFAIGWLEADDAVWIVHGPLASAEANAAAAEALTVSAPLARNEWCGIASAEQNVAMLWRSGDRLSILMCTKKKCGGIAGTVALDRKVPILGFGCLRDACLIAANDRSGAPRLAYVTSSGKSKWTRPIASAASTVSIVGYGDRAFAVGYATRTGAEVVRFDAAGELTPLWRDATSAAAPALAWSSGRLLIARRGDALSHEVIAAPR